MQTQHSPHYRSQWLALAAMALLVCFSGTLFGQNKAADHPLKLVAKATKADALYDVGETVTFEVDFQKDGKPLDGKVQWTLSKDGVAPVRRGEIELSGGKGQVQGSLDEPGFLRFIATVPGAGVDGKDLNAIAGAGIEPLKIAPSMPVPADFDEFWAAQLQELAKIPANVRVTPAKVTSPHSNVEIFDLQADSVDGVPVSGYLAKPKGAKAKSLPAIITLHGAGVNSAQPGRVSTWARDGFIALDINAHGLPNGESREFYKKLADGDLRRYRVEGRESRDKVYFRKMFLRVVRAIDAITKQPEWDGKTVILYGTSQGGAQSLAGAGLDDRVTFFVAGVPAMCDHTGMVADRAAGWPKMVPVSGKGSGAGPDQRVVEAVRYYDGVNFASRIKAPGILTVGFIDGTCPPTTVYAAYNALNGEKEIFNDIPAGHENTREATKAMRDAVLKHAKRSSR